MEFERKDWRIGFSWDRHFNWLPVANRIYLALLEGMAGDRLVVQKGHCAHRQEVGIVCGCLFFRSFRISDAPAPVVVSIQTVKSKERIGKAQKSEGISPISNPNPRNDPLLFHPSIHHIYHIHLDGSNNNGRLDE